MASCDILIIMKMIILVFGFPLRLLAVLSYVFAVLVMSFIKADWEPMDNTDFDDLKNFLLRGEL